MNLSPDEMQQAYRNTCTHYRNGNKIYDAKTNSVVFDGNKGRQKWQGLGINTAKHYVSKNHLRSFTV